ncbi:hypothetical protein ES703_35307 [subsurface metagenome]
MLQEGPTNYLRQRCSQEFGNSLIGKEHLVSSNHHIAIVDVLRQPPVLLLRCLELLCPCPGLLKELGVLNGYRYLVADGIE